MILQGSVAIPLDYKLDPQQQNQGLLKQKKLIYVLNRGLKFSLKVKSIFIFASEIFLIRKQFLECEKTIFSFIVMR